MKLLYLSDCYTESSVFASQVHELCDLQTSFLDVTLLAHSHAKSLSENTVAHRYSLQLRPWVANMSMPLIAAVVGIRYGLSGIFKNFDIVHCRGHVMTFVVLVARIVAREKFKVVSDIRGESAIEAENNPHSVFGGFKKLMFRAMEILIFRCADHVLFVSEKMASHFMALYKLPDTRVSIFPTVVNTRFFKKSAQQRAEKRQELGITESQFVYVYSGGVSYWQNVDKIIGRFRDVAKIDKSLVLLILTTQPHIVEKMVADLAAGDCNIIIRSCSYEQVGAYLNAADVGLIIRDNSAVNSVASPTKVHEYFACELPIINKLEGIGARNYSHWLQEVKTFRSLDEVAEGHRRIYAQLI